MFSSRKFMIREATKSLVKQVCHRNTCNKPKALVKVGDSLPACDLYEDFPTNSIQMPNFLVGKNVILFTVPGAFAPGCSQTHLPGYVKAADEMKKNGVDEIICVSVNDAYVMGAWAAKQKTKGKVRMFADPTGSFVSSLGLGTKIVPLGGFRAKRTAMVIVDNVVKEVQVEPDGTGLSCSLAGLLNYKKHLTKSELS